MSNNRFRTAGRILVPLTRTELLTAFFIGFILSLGDLGITLLIIPPGMSTILIKIVSVYRVLQMQGVGYADVLPVFQVPDNKADAVSCERLQ